MHLDVFVGQHGTQRTPSASAWASRPKSCAESGSRSDWLARGFLDFGLRRKELAGIFQKNGQEFEEGTTSKVVGGHKSPPRCCPPKGPLPEFTNQILGSLCLTLQKQHNLSVSDSE